MSPSDWGQSPVGNAISAYQRLFVIEAGLREWLEMAFPAVLWKKVRRPRDLRAAVGEFLKQQDGAKDQPEESLANRLAGGADGWALDFLFTRELQQLIQALAPDLHTAVAQDLEKLYEVRNSVAHFRFVSELKLELIEGLGRHILKATDEATRQCKNPNHLLGGFWLAAWMDGEATNSSCWSRVVELVAGRSHATVDYGNFEVPAIGRFRQPYVRDGSVLFPGGLYRNRQRKPQRLEPVFVELDASHANGPGRLLTKQEVECLLEPEVLRADPEPSGKSWRTPAGLTLRCTGNVFERYDARARPSEGVFNVYESPGLPRQLWFFDQAPAERSPRRLARDATEALSGGPHDVQDG